MPYDSSQPTRWSLGSCQRQKWSPAGHTRNHAQAFALSIEAGMPQETPQEVRGIVGAHIQSDQGVRGMAKVSLEEILVQGAEGGPVQRVQERQDVRILDAGGRDGLCPILH